MLRLTCQAYAWPQVSANGRIAVMADSVELISGRANRICLATIVCAKLHTVSKYAAPQVHFNNYRDSFQFVCCGFLGIGKSAVHNPQIKRALDICLDVPQGCINSFI